MRRLWTGATSVGSDAGGAQSVPVSTQTDPILARMYDPCARMHAPFQGSRVLLGVGIDALADLVNVGRALGIDDEYFVLDFVDVRAHVTD